MHTLTPPPYTLGIQIAQIARLCHTIPPTFSKCCTNTTMVHSQPREAEVHRAEQPPIEHPGERHISARLTGSAAYNASKLKKKHHCPKQQLARARVRVRVSVSYGIMVITKSYVIEYNHCNLQATSNNKHKLQYIMRPAGDNTIL